MSISVKTDANSGVSRTHREDGEAVHELFVEGSREHGRLERRRRVIHLKCKGSHCTVGERNWRDITTYRRSSIIHTSLYPNVNDSNEKREGKYLYLGIFAGIHDQAMHVRSVAEDATTQQNIFGPETEFASVLAFNKVLLWKSETHTCDKTLKLWYICRICVMLYYSWYRRKSEREREGEKEKEREGERGREGER